MKIEGIEIGDMSITAIIRAARADERAKLAKLHAKVVTELQDVLALLIPDVVHVVPSSGLTPQPKPPRKPRTIKLDEGIVESIMAATPYHDSSMGWEARNIFKDSGMSSRKQFGNYLAALVKLGRIKQTGKGKNATYRLAPNASQMTNGAKDATN